jgi:hypothetical protein
MKMIMLFIFCCLISSCTDAKQTENRFKRKEVINYNVRKLVVKKQIDKDEINYYTKLTAKFNEQARQYSINYGAGSTSTELNKKINDFCYWSLKTVKDISTKPISSERESINARIREFVRTACTDEQNRIALQSDYDFSIKQLESLVKALPTSADLLSWLADQYLQEDFKTRRNKYTNKPLELYKKSFVIDQYNLNTFRKFLKTSSIENEYAKTVFNKYCKKAIELKQWDHIFYLSNAAASSGTDYLTACLEPDNPKYKEFKCSCPEAVQLVAGQWPKEVLYSRYLIDPHGEDPSEEVRLGEKKIIRDLIKKHYGRDLDKEK